MHSLGQSLSRKKSIHKPIPYRQILNPSSLGVFSRVFFLFTARSLLSSLLSSTFPNIDTF